MVAVKFVASWGPYNADDRATFGDERGNALIAGGVAVVDVVEPVAEAVVEPVAEAVVEPVAEAVVEPVAEAVVEPDADEAFKKAVGTTPVKKTKKPS